jgi:signal transduction histidine kinase
MEREISLREYILGIFLMSMGFLLNILYWGTELLIRGKSPYEDFIEDPVSHTFIILAIPMMMLVGYLFIRERKMRIRLREANNFKDLFTDILSHDLLNPAGVIKNATELLLDDLPERKEAKVIKRSTERLIETIENAAKLSKLKSIKEMEKEIIDLSKIIEEAISEMSPLVDEAGMVLENKVTKPLPVYANPFIKDVFTNLIGNAVKYASTGKRIIIDSEEKGSRVRILVKDFGPGIKDEDKEYIFSRFKRRERKGVKGTGLGLAIARNIVKQHNGKIWVEDNWVEYRDEEGQVRRRKQGSIFVIELPKAKS